MADDETAVAVVDLIDAIVVDPQLRNAVRSVVLSVGSGPALRRLRARLAAQDDRWTRRARPTFLYVMYALLLWSIPIGLIAAARPALAAAIARGMAAYLAAIPEPLYALFGTRYVGYTVARQWGKARGTDR